MCLSIPRYTYKNSAKHLKNGVIMLQAAAKAVAAADRVENESGHAIGLMSHIT